MARVKNRKVPAPRSDVSKLKETTQVAPFVKTLAANDRATRIAALESLKLFLQRPIQIEPLAVRKLWKGLFYTMWFCDRALPQQRLAVDIGSLVSIVHEKNLWEFVGGFWDIMGRQWNSIDHLRVDKFYMLMRKMLNATFLRLKSNEWDSDKVKAFTNQLSNTSLNPQNSLARYPLGITLHIIDIYTEELEKVLELSEESDSEDIQRAIEDVPLSELYQPFQELKISVQKVIRKRLAEDFFSDARLLKWGVVSPEEKEEESEDEEEEWTGFK